MLWRSRAVFLLAFASFALAQSPITFEYFYDDLNQLVRVVDSTGISIEYVYDAAGNIVQIRRSTVGSGVVSVFGVSAQSVATGGTITIQGQGFSPNPALDRVTVGGVTVTVLSATNTMIVVMIPANGMSGPISVTVGGSTATSDFNETVIPTPIISSVNPRAAQAGTIVNVLVTGANLQGSTFSLSPGGGTVAATINASGTSAALTITTAANANGRFAVIASNGSSNSGAAVTPANAFGVFTDPNADADNDGLANGFELLLGTDPFNPDTDGDGFPDGVELASGSDPLNPLCTPLNCRIPGGESDSVSFSAINLTAPASSFREADSVTFSVLNTVNPTSLFSEADSVTFSVLNTVNPTSLFSEADSVTFSVCNSATGNCPGFTHSIAQPATTSAVRNPSQQSGGAGELDNPGAPVPAVVVVMPLRNAPAVPLNTPVILIFSEPMDPETVDGDAIQLFAGDRLLHASVSISSDFRAVTLITSFPPDAQISIVATNQAKSLFGTPLTGFRSMFRTGNGRDFAAIEQQPVSGAGGVPVDAPVLLKFEKTETARAEADAIRVTQNGLDLAGVVNLEAGALRFNPAAPYSAGAVVEVSLNDSGRYSGAFVTTGTTGALPTPLRAYVRAGPNPAIEVEYDRRLDPQSINAETVGLRQQSDGSALPVTVTMRGDRTIRITSLEPLSFNTAYYYEISTGVRDVSGVSPAGIFGRAFTPQPAQTDRFVTTAILPADGAAGVRVSSSVSISFSHPVNPLSISTDTLRVTSESQGVIPMSVSFADHFRQVVLTPLTSLPERDSVTLTVSGVEDGAGNVIEPSVTKFFTGDVRSGSIAENTPSRRSARVSRGQR